jgi:hypothetical protein
MFQEVNKYHRNRHSSHHRNYLRKVDAPRLKDAVARELIVIDSVKTVDMCHLTREEFHRI